MKKTIQLLGLVFALAILSSCYRSPDLGELSSELVVVTDTDINVDFSTYNIKYYLSDTVRVVTNRITDDHIIVSPESDEIIAKIVTNMTARGFNRSTDPNDVILPSSGVNIAMSPNIIRVTNTGQTCYGWGGYPGYYPPWGWGGGGYYYPYCSSYKYDTGTLVIEMADLLSTSEVGKVNSIWTATIFGVLNSNDNINEDRALRSIDQAFEQSPYIQKN
jgi:hypothetical protein